jgi:hypothetical protein
LVTVHGLSSQSFGKWRIVEDRNRNFGASYTTCDNDLSGRDKILVEKMVSPPKIMSLLRQALTSKINDREMFMKGIDYSYYYEEEDIVDNE